jgi:hypothetical protein
MEGKLDNIYSFNTLYSPSLVYISTLYPHNGAVLYKRGDDLPELTLYQKEAIIGLLLGDGHISKSSKG